MTIIKLVETDKYLFLMESPCRKVLNNELKCSLLNTKGDVYQNWAIKAIPAAHNFNEYSLTVNGFPDSMMLQLNRCVLCSTKVQSSEKDLMRTCVAKREAGENPARSRRCKHVVLS